MTRTQSGVYTSVLFLTFLALYVLPQPAELGSGFAGILFLLALLVGGLTFLTIPATGVDAGEAQSRLRWDLVIVGGIGVFLSSIYWWRASMGTGSMESHLSFVIGRGLFFWLPAVAPAALYRAPGEGWLPIGRGRFALRLAVGAAAGGVGAALQYIAALQHMLEL